MPDATEAPTAGAVIREYMTRHGITHYTAATAAGLNQSTVSRILADTQDPSLSALLRLLGGLGLSLRWLHEQGVRPPAGWPARNTAGARRLRAGRAGQTARRSFPHE